MANEYLKCDACGKEKNAKFNHGSDGYASVCCFCGYAVPERTWDRWCPELMAREIVRRIKGEPNLCDSCIRTGSMLEKA